LKIVSRVKNADCQVFQVWRIWRHPKMGSVSVFSRQSRNGPTDQPEPSGGFRLCCLRVPPVTCKKILSFFLSSKLVKCQIIIFSEKHLPLPPITILRQLSLTITIRMSLPTKNSNSNITDEAKNDPLLRGHLSPKLNLFDQILP
jgi:hypothetical protein